jgi:hypothetical protein
VVFAQHKHNTSTVFVAIPMERRLRGGLIALREELRIVIDASYILDQVLVILLAEATKEAIDLH